MGRNPGNCLSTNEVSTQTQFNNPSKGFIFFAYKTQRNKNKFNTIPFVVEDDMPRDY